MNAYAIIVAGGKGMRLGNAVPKQFLDIKGKPILYYSIKQFIEAIPDIKIIVVLPVDFLNFANTLLQCFPERIDITIVTGGAERYHSVVNGCNAIEKATSKDIVFIHDAARPMLTKELILRCRDCAVENGNAIPVIAVKDSIRKIEGEGNKAVNRNEYKIVQTPQTFQYSILQKIISLPYAENFTDEATALELVGEKVVLVDGDENNFKITHSGDMLLAEQLL